MNSWECADSWVLMGLSAESESLDGVIGRMDALNYAIPSREELEIGLRGLVGPGLADVDAAGYRLTKAGQQFVAAAAGRTRGWHAVWEDGGPEPASDPGPA
jgi:hypothetical protein